MKLGLIGLGVVGSALQNWLKENTSHELKLYDPPKGLTDSLENCEAIFISVPVPANQHGQDLTILKECVAHAKQFTDKVFIRSTVLPGTSDNLECFAMPEFLTERNANFDMQRLPIVAGYPKDLGDDEITATKLKILSIFPNKLLIFIENKEAELAKFTHNCFGALKVTYFNIIFNLCREMQIDFEAVKTAANITGYLGSQHQQVPGPDGKFGYGGKCFPENVAALTAYLYSRCDFEHAQFFKSVELLNNNFRFLCRDENQEILDGYF